MSGSVSALLAALASGEVEVVDLSQPLSETTPIIQLPPPFANTPGLKVHEISQLRRARPRLGLALARDRRARRHALRRADPLDHGPGQGRSGTLPASDLIGPAVVFDRVAESEADPDYVLTVDDINAWGREHGPLPEGGWLFLRTGWDTPRQRLRMRS